MSGQSVVRIELSYDEGLLLNPAVEEPLPDALLPALEQSSEFQWLPALEALPLLIESIRAAGIEPQLGAAADSLRRVGVFLAEAEELKREWLQGRGGDALAGLRGKLTDIQLQNAASLAFRRRAILENERALDPITTAIAACEIARLRGARRAIVISPTSRHHLWQSRLQRLGLERGHILQGSRKERRTQYSDSRALLFLDPGDLTRDRILLKQYAPDILMLDEALRIMRLPRRHTDHLRGAVVANGRTWDGKQGNNLPVGSGAPTDPTGRAQTSFVFALTPVSCLSEPEALHTLMSIICPVMAGDRLLWSEHYVDRRARVHPKVQHETELRARVAPFVVGRAPHGSGASSSTSPVSPSTPQTELRRVALGKTQRNAYERSLKSLLEAIEKAELDPAEQRAADGHLASLRENCNSVFIKRGATLHASKLDELRAIMEGEILPAGRKAIIFSRWEPMTRAISETLKQAKVPHVRHYRKLPVKRREGLLARFRDSAEGMVLLSTDCEMRVPNLNADMLIHYDVPWESEVVTWRRARLEGDSYDEIVLTAADTLEEALWTLDKPDSCKEVPDAEEEDPRGASVHLWEDGGHNLAKLRKVLAWDASTAEAASEDVVSERTSTELESTPLASRRTSTEPESTPLASRATSTELESTPLASERTSTELESTPLASRRTSTEPESTPLASGRTSTELESTPLASERTSTEPESTPLASGRTSTTLESMPVANGATSEAWETRTVHHQPSGEHVNESEDLFYQLEIPLKAANRILAGVPVVGKPIAKINGTMWELFSGRARNR